MPVINIIDFKRKGLIKVYLFFLSIFSESSIARNISLFKNSNIIQMDIDKTNQK